MADAPWRPEALLLRWGEDIEGKKRGCSWCSLCGRDCREGIVVSASGRRDDGIQAPSHDTAFCCLDCAAALGRLAAYVRETSSSKPSSADTLAQQWQRALSHDETSSPKPSSADD